MTTTHAIRVHAYGGPEVLQWEVIPLRDPGPGEVRLRQTKIGVNFIDIYHRTGLYPLPCPFVPGREATGVVEALGPDVTGLNLGDRVAYAMVPGSYVEHCVVPAARLVSLPATIDDATAAGMMLRGMTVQALIREIYRVKAGDTILVHAAAGGIGLILCAWASSLGAIVIGTVSSDEKATLATAHGCTYPVVVPRDDIVSRVREITEGRMVPVVYDSVGKDTFDHSLNSLAPRGMMVLFGQSSGRVPPVDLNILAPKGSLVVTRPTLDTFIAARSDLQRSAAELFDVVASGAVPIRLGQSFPLRDAAAAHAALESRQTTGSTILTV